VSKIILITVSTELVTNYSLSLYYGLYVPIYLRTYKWLVQLDPNPDGFKLKEITTIYEEEPETERHPFTEYRDSPAEYITLS